MRNKNSEEKILIRLIFPFLGIYVAWFFLYEFILAPSGIPDEALTSFTAAAGESLLNLLGYHTSTTVSEGRVILSLNNDSVLRIAHECNGLVLFVLFTALLILLPGKQLYKGLYALFGLLIIFLSNVARVASLSLIHLYSPELLHFNHKYTFTILVYSIIFMLWIGWGKLQKSRLLTETLAKS